MTKRLNFERKQKLQKFYQDLYLQLKANISRFMLDVFDCDYNYVENFFLSNKDTINLIDLDDVSKNYLYKFSKHYWNFDNADRMVLQVMLMRKIYTIRLHASLVGLLKLLDRRYGSTLAKTLIDLLLNGLDTDAQILLMRKTRHRVKLMILDRLELIVLTDVQDRNLKQLLFSKDITPKLADRILGVTNNNYDIYLDFAEDNQNDPYTLKIILKLITLSGVAQQHLVKNLFLRGFNLILDSNNDSSVIDNNISTLLLTLIDFIEDSEPRVALNIDYLMDFYPYIENIKIGNAGSFARDCFYKIFNIDNLKRLLLRSTYPEHRKRIMAIIAIKERYIDNSI